MKHYIEIQKVRETDVIVYNQGLVGNITANAFNIYYNIEKWYRQ